MEMRPRWNCPDLPRDQWLRPSCPVPGSTAAFDDCPAYYLREAHMGLPAAHLLETGTHVAAFVSEWAFEVEAGARSVDTLTAKGREAVHLYINQKAQRQRYQDELRREKRGKHG
jgi:hypothetical protein